MMQISREIERRHEWIADTMRRAQRRLGFTRREQLAAEMGLTRKQLQDRLADPGHMTLYELWRLEAVLRRAGMAEEAAAIWPSRSIRVA